MYHHNGDRPLDNNVRLQLPADGRPIANVPVRAEGNLYYDTISDIVYLSDGIAWIPFGGFGATVDLQRAYENGVTTGNLGLIEDPSGRPLFVISPTEGLQTFQNQLGSGTDIIPVAGLFDMATFFIEDQPNRLILDPSIATDVILPPIATDPNTGYPGTISVGVGYSTTISNQAAPGGSDLTVRPTAPDTPDPVVTIPPGFTATIQAVDNGATFGWVIVMFASGSTGSSSIVDLQKAYENGTVTGNLGRITDPSGRQLFDLSPTTGLKTFQNELGFGTNIIDVAGLFTMETFFLEDQPNRLFLNPTLATDVTLPPIAADPNTGYPGTHSVGVGYSVTISNQAMAGGPDLTVRPTAPDTPDPVVMIPPEYGAIIQAVENAGGGTFSWVVSLFAPGSGGGGPVVPTTLQDAYDGTTLLGTQPAIQYDSVGIYGPITIRQPVAGNTVNELMVFQDNADAFDYLSITQQGLFGRAAVGTGVDVISYGGTNSLTSTNMLIIGGNTMPSATTSGLIVGTGNTVGAGNNKLVFGGGNSNISTGVFGFSHILGSNQTIGGASTSHHTLIGDINVSNNGSHKYALGLNNMLTGGNEAFTFGRDNIISGGTPGITHNLYALGEANTISSSGTDIYILGKLNTVSAGTRRFIMGQSNIISSTSDALYLFGNDNVISATRNRTFVLGFNVTAPTNAVVLKPFLSTQMDFNTGDIANVEKTYMINTGGCVLAKSEITPGTLQSTATINPWQQIDQGGIFAPVAAGPTAVLVVIIPTASEIASGRFFASAATAAGGASTTYIDFIALQSGLNGNSSAAVTTNDTTGGAGVTYTVTFAAGSATLNATTTVVNTRIFVTCTYHLLKYA